MKKFSLRNPQSIAPHPTHNAPIFPRSRIAASNVPPHQPVVAGDAVPSRSTPILCASTTARLSAPEFVQDSPPCALPSRERARGLGPTKTISPRAAYCAWSPQAFNCIGKPAERLFHALAEGHFLEFTRPFGERPMAFDLLPSLLSAALPLWRLLL